MSAIEESSTLSPPIAWVDGRFVGADQAVLPVHDLAIVGGQSVTEMLRTFGGRLFHMEEHLQRLEHSLAEVGWSTGWNDARWREVLEHLVATNTRVLAPGDDLGVVLFVTAGWNATYVGASAAAAHGHTIVVHSFVLPNTLWRERLRQGVRLVGVSGKHIPAGVVSPLVKHRNRLHWTLADRAAQTIEAGSAALLLSDDDEVTETATSNVIGVFGQELVTPPYGVALEGVSLQQTLALGRELGYTVTRRPLRLAELAQADEILLTSTPTCVLPVTALNGQSIGAGRPGRHVAALRAAWSALVGIDLDRQLLGADTSMP